jgi:hypothetical protein
MFHTKPADQSADRPPYPTTHSCVLNRLIIRQIMCFRREKLEEERVESRSERWLCGTRFANSEQLLPNTANAILFSSVCRESTSFKLSWH